MHYLCRMQAPRIHSAFCCLPSAFFGRGLNTCRTPPYNVGCRAAHDKDKSYGHGTVDRRRGGGFGGAGWLGFCHPQTVVAKSSAAVGRGEVAVPPHARTTGSQVLAKGRADRQAARLALGRL